MFRLRFGHTGLLATLMFLLLLPDRGIALETVTIGQDGELDWQGNGAASVAIVEAEHRSPLDPNNLLVGNAPGDLIEFESADFSRSILLRRIAEGENVSDGTIERGGSINAPNVFDFSGTFKPLDLQHALEEIISIEKGGELLAFERKNFNALGRLVILNLGARFGVDRIRFYPRNSGAVDSTVQQSPSTPFQNDFLRAYELFINDGLSLTKENTQIWELLQAETDNKAPVVDIRIDPPRYIQSVRLRATSPIDFEIDELEVFGTGFLSTARYVSDIFDAGQPAVWGSLRWVEEILGDPKFSSLRIRTRTGADPTPFVFTRKLQGKRDAEEIPSSLADPSVEMELAEYRNLYGGHAQADNSGRYWEAGSVKDDLVNWSPFSTPYPASAANGPSIPITSPGPRRYFQFQVFFRSDDLEAARVLKSLSFELLTPPIADGIVGEVFPREVAVSQVIPFTFAVRATMETAGLRGFDTIEISTPAKVESIDAVEILDREGQLLTEWEFAGFEDASSAGDFQIVSVDDDRFAVRFPLVDQDDALVRIRFQTEVLTYSTNFTATVQLSTEPGAAQVVSSGDAASLGTDDDPNLSSTTVLSPSVLRQGRLLDKVDLVPAVFTPNGDGINDVTAVHYNLLSLSAGRPIEVGVYDLNGRLVRMVHNAPELSGRYEDKAWDGRDSQGQLVPPGLYIVRVAVDGDSQQEEQSQVVAVAY